MNMLQFKLRTLPVMLFHYLCFGLIQKLLGILSGPCVFELNDKIFISGLKLQIRSAEGIVFLYFHSRDPAAYQINLQKAS